MVVKIPVPTTLLISTHMAVNPLIRRDPPSEGVLWGEPSDKFFPNEKPVFHLSGPHGKALTSEAGAKPASLFLISDIRQQESPSAPESSRHL